MLVELNLMTLITSQIPVDSRTYNNAASLLLTEIESEIKTGLSRAKLSHLMDAETWMNANMAVELGFADEVMKRNEAENDIPQPAVAVRSFFPPAFQ